MKPVILTFVAYYLPGYRGGGPTRSVANMVEHLSSQFEFKIVTSHTDLGETIPYENIQIDAWNQIGHAKVYYASLKMRNFKQLSRLISDTPHDLMYLNSFFDPVFTLRPLLYRLIGSASSRPLIVAPRGEFSSAALRLKGWKKRPFLLFSRICGFYREAYWHASSVQEAEDIRRTILVHTTKVHMTKAIVVAPDLLFAPEHFPDAKTADFNTNNHRLRVCFLSRIVPMKNLDYALGILAKVKCLVEFNIYGPKEDLTYWRQCEVICAQLPSNVIVNYRGGLPHYRVAQVIAEHDIFFVPSRGENFGHVFLEALSSGVPILVSDNTPWRNLQQTGVGWDISLTEPRLFAEALDEAAKYSPEERQCMRRRCLDFARTKIIDPNVRQLNTDLFINALAIGH